MISYKEGTYFYKGLQFAIMLIYKERDNRFCAWVISENVNKLYIVYVLIYALLYVTSILYICMYITYISVLLYRSWELFKLLLYITIYNFYTI